MKRSRFGNLPARAWSVIRLLTGIICGTGLLLALGTAAFAAPRAVISETTKDFGKVFEDKGLSHTFVIKNEGDKPLKVEDVDPDCACTVADYDGTIPPGGQGQISLTIKPFSVLRDFLKKTAVKLNDPAQPELELIMKGYVEPIIEIKPSHIVRLRGAVSDDLRGQVTFISHQSGPWEINKVINGIPGMVEAHLKTEKPGKVYVLEVKNIRKDAGHYGGVIELLTSSKQRPRLIVRVFANLYPSPSPGTHGP
jgi:hypothetical protein